MHFTSSLLVVFTALFTLASARPTLLQREAVFGSLARLQPRGITCTKAYKECAAGSAIIFKCCVNTLIQNHGFTVYGQPSDPSCFNEYNTNLNTHCAAGQAIADANNCQDHDCCTAAYLQAAGTTLDNAVAAQQCTQAPCGNVGPNQVGYNGYLGMYVNGLDSRICFDDASQGIIYV